MLLSDGSPDRALERPYVRRLTVHHALRFTVSRLPVAAVRADRLARSGIDYKTPGLPRTADGKVNHDRAAADDGGRQAGPDRPVATGGEDRSPARSTRPGRSRGWSMRRRSTCTNWDATTPACSACRPGRAAYQRPVRKVHPDAGADHGAVRVAGVPADLHRWPAAARRSESRPGLATQSVDGRATRSSSRRSATTTGRFSTASGHRHTEALARDRAHSRGATSGTWTSR